MANKARSDNQESMLWNKKRKILLWVSSVLFVLAVLYSCYALVRLLRFRARSRAWPPLTSLPQLRTGHQSDARCPTISVIPLQDIIVHQFGSGLESQTLKQIYAFLGLPPEIRTEIYSYLLPGNEPVSISRGFRQTCHQINREIEHEARKTFVHKMVSLQQLASGSDQFVTIFYSAEHYHVEMVLQLPQPYFPPSLPPPIAQAQTVVDAVALAFVELLPLNTRSVSITLQPHPQGLPSSFERYFDSTWSALWDYLQRNSKAAVQDMTDLRRISILTGSPVFMVPELRFYGFSSILNKFELLGIRFGYDKDFQCQLEPVLRQRLRCRRLFVKILAPLSHRLKMYIRYKEVLS